MYPDQRSRSYELFQRARRVMPGGNTRHTVFFDPYPVYAVSGKGCRVTDADGVERVDFVNNYSSLVHGHSHPNVVEAIRQQAALAIAIGLPTESEIVLAEMLVERLPSVEQVRFCNSGSEAIMFAIRAARAYTGRPKVAKVEGAFHGAYDYAEVSMDPSPESWGADDPLPVAHAAGTPLGLLADVVVIPFNDVEHTRRILDVHRDDLAAVLFDPVVSRMGFLEATPEYLRFLREYTHASASLLIIDEVFSFRAGYNGAQGRYGVDADLTALGKIIGGGIPVGAFGGKRDIMSVFDSRARTGAGGGDHGWLLGQARVPHGGTFNANPLAMVAGRVTLELLSRAEVDRINRLGDRLRAGINGALAVTDVPGRAGGVGSMVSVLLATGETYSNYREFLPLAAQSMPRMAPIHRAMLNRGFLMIAHGGFVVSTAMSEREIDDCVEAFASCLRDLATPVAVR